MGRTNPTYRMLIESKIGELDDFRKALRKGDRDAFDELMKKTREHASSISYLAPKDVSETMWLAILLEFEKEIEELKRRVGNVPD